MMSAIKNEVPFWLAVQKRTGRNFQKKKTKKKICGKEKKMLKEK